MIYRELVAFAVILWAPYTSSSDLVGGRNLRPRRRHLWDVYGNEALLQHISLKTLSHAPNDNYFSQTTEDDETFQRSENTFVIVDQLLASQKDYFQFWLDSFYKLNGVPYPSVIPGRDSPRLTGVVSQVLETDALDKRGRVLSKTAANIEILLVVDNSIFRRYLKANSYRADLAKKKILHYFSMVFAMVNQRFETISDPDFSLNVHISGVYVAETRMEAAWIEYMVKWSKSLRNGMVSASRALKRFQKWLRRSRSHPKFDHAVVFTKYMLTKRNKKVDGLAYVGSMCKVSVGKSASIVHDQGLWSVGVIAHELGHSLGATHDGEGANLDCPASGNYVMAPQSSQEPRVANNSYYFSSCSVKQIKALVMSRQASCLKDKPTKQVQYDLKENPPGETFNESVQCKMVFGKSSRFCDQGSVRSEMCRRLWCTSPESPHMCKTSSRLMALPGTKCGNGGSCHLGECSIFTANCPARDSSFCSAVTSLSPSLCNKPRYKNYCCHSCARQPDYK